MVDELHGSEVSASNTHAEAEYGEEKSEEAIRLPNRGVARAAQVHESGDDEHNQRSKQRSVESNDDLHLLSKHGHSTRTQKDTDSSATSESLGEGERQSQLHVLEVQRLAEQRVEIVAHSEKGNGEGTDDGN